MSHKEIDRLTIIEQVNNKQLSQIKASTTLKITTRQIRRLLAKYRTQGAQGLISKHRNKVSNNRIPTEVRDSAIAIVKKTI